MYKQIFFILSIFIEQIYQQKIEIFKKTKSENLNKFHNSILRHQREQKILIYDYNDNFCYKTVLNRELKDENANYQCYFDQSKENRKLLLLPANLLSIEKLVFGYKFQCFIVTKFGFLYCISLDGINFLPPIPDNINKDIISVAAGMSHVCFDNAEIKYDDNNMKQYEMNFTCFGVNYQGQLDIPHEVRMNNHTNTDLVALDALTAGPTNTCVSLRQGKLVCWGSTRQDTDINEVPSIIGKYQPNSDPLKNPTYFDVSISLTFACAIAVRPIENQRELVCWGYDIHGLTEVSDQFKHYTTKISTGDAHACVIQSVHTDIIILNDIKDRLVCWGSNQQGQIIVPREFNDNVEYVQAGTMGTCAIKLNFQMQCWGKTTFVPSEVTSISRLIAAGGRNTCWHMGGSLHCKGNNEFGQMEVPERQINSSQIIEADWDQNCSANLSFIVDCWGQNQQGQTDVDIAITSGTNKITQISSGLKSSCAIAGDNNAIYCWGDLYEMHPNASVILDFTIDLKEVTVGDDQICASKFFLMPFNIINHQRTTLSCWGNNDQGQTDFLPHLRYRNIMQITSGSAHVCLIERFFDQALATPAFINHLYCWGSNSRGQVDIPMEVILEVERTSAGSVHTCILSRIQGVRCWGYFWEGVKVEVDIHVRLVSSGFEHSCQIADTSGYANCLGSDEYGMSSLGIDSQAYFQEDSVRVRG